MSRGRGEGGERIGTSPWLCSPLLKRRGLLPTRKGISRTEEEKEAASFFRQEETEKEKNKKEGKKNVDDQL